MSLGGGDWGGGGRGPGRYCGLLKSCICTVRDRKSQTWLTCFLSAGAMRGGSLGKGGCITYRRIISCVGGAFLHHCSYRHSDTVSKVGFTQSAIWQLHSQQFGTCTVRNLAFTRSAIQHLYSQQSGMYTVSKFDIYTLPCSSTHMRPPYCTSTFFAI